jgi:hypothetical protein
MTRKDFIRQYLFTLVMEYEKLEKERQALLAAADRITAIQAEKSDLLIDGQAALDLYNSIWGTTHTLQDVRSWYNAASGTINEPVIVEPPGEPLP